MSGRGARKCAESDAGKHSRPGLAGGGFRSCATQSSRRRHGRSTCVQVRPWREVERRAGPQAASGAIMRTLRRLSLASDARCSMTASGTPKIGTMTSGKALISSFGASKAKS
jgi:hypothetical protein